MNEKILILFISFILGSSSLYCSQNQDYFVHYVQLFELIPEVKDLNKRLEQELDQAGEGKQVIIKLAHAKVLIERSYLKQSFFTLYNLKIEEIENDEKLRACYQLVRARLDFKLGKLEKAIEENEKSYLIFLQNKLFEEALLAAINQSFYLTLKKVQNAKIWFDQSLDLLKKSDNQGLSILFYSNYAFYHLVGGELNIAQKYIEQAESLNRKSESYSFLDDYRIHILKASIAENQGNRINEKHHLQEAKEICMRYGMLENLREVLNAISHNFQEENQPHQALNYARKADSVGQLLPNQMLSEEMIRLDLKRRMNEIEAKKKRVQEKLEIERRRKRLVLSFSLALFIGLIAVSFLWQKNRIKTKSLVQKNLELSKCQKPINSRVQKNVDHSLIQKLENFVIEKEAFQNPNLTLDKLAKKLGTNRTYLSESINANFNKNYNQWINEIRISKARNLLVDPNYQHYSIEGIANEVGYSSISVFNTAFKKNTGITPSQLRKGSYKSVF